MQLLVTQVQLEGSSEGLLQAGSVGRTLEAVGCSCW